MIEAIIPIEDTLVDGLYTRIAYMTKGQIVAGSKHKKQGLAMLLTGKLQVIDGDTKYEISAPSIFNTEKGTQKLVNVLEDCTFVTAHSVEAVTKEGAEKELFEQVPQLTRIRNSFKTLLIENKTTDKEVHKVMESLPVFTESQDKYYLGKSSIHGIGTFSKIKFNPGDTIATSVLDNVRLTTARYVNHSDIPNAKMINYRDSVVLVATTVIPIGYEILIDYRKGRICQQ